MDGIHLSIDSYTLDAAAGKRRVQEILPDGSLVYKEPKAPGDDLSEQVGRLWHEVPDGILNLYDDRLARLPQDEAVVPAEEDSEDEKEEREPGEAMTLDEMQEMRVRVRDELNVARNELWFVLQLAKTLSQSTSFTSNPPDYPPPSGPSATPKKGKKQQHQQQQQQQQQSQASVPPPQPDPSSSTARDDTVLPPGTFSVTPSSLSRIPQTAIDDAYNIQLALASKEQALDECSALVDAAIDELHRMSEASEGFWTDVRQLRDGQRGRGQWAIVPRPDFGRVMGEGEVAKDVVIPYATDEAPPALRTRSLAAFDLDPQAKDRLAFGARSYLRLRVGYQGAQTTIPSVPTDVRAIMQTAQDEAFEEELFAEIRAEALALGGIVEGRQVRMDELTFELYDPRSDPNSTSPAPNEHQLISEIILLISKLHLLNIHKYRKTQLLSTSTSTTPSSSPPPILAPILQCLVYRKSTHSVQNVLSSLANALERAGIAVDVRHIWSAAMLGSDVLAKGLESGELMRYLGGTAVLEVDGLLGIQIASSPLRPLTITTSQATFPSDTDGSALLLALSEDIALQLLSWAEMTLRDQTNEVVFLDDLDGSVRVGQAGYVRFEIDTDSSRTELDNDMHVDGDGNDGIDADGGDGGFDASDIGVAIRAIFEPIDLVSGDDEDVKRDGREVYDAAEGTLRDWLAGIARRT